ncbi:hypothetical protein [Streptomyces sp. NPDC047525]|uniref:hypothetical protein n=1 Tax=Streptomyces sp. NPDC047525 TaxID=3155264 RepID=UPI003410ED82
MITTGYGSWYNHTGSNTSPEGDIADYMNGGGSDWCERMDKAGATEAIADEYREAVCTALPAGIYLTGDEFIGLHHSDPDYTDEIGDFDIRAAIEEIDLGGIVAKHDIGA